MSSCYIIGEAGSNHDGKFEQALTLTEVAADAGCDAVKFQCLHPFQRKWWPALAKHARSLKLDLLATPFDVDAVRFLETVDCPLLKVASPELVNLDLIQAVARTGRPIILSTGMADEAEIRATLSLIEPQPTTLLQCTTAYPANPEQANLRAMQTMATEYDLPVGLSDHTLGIAVPIAAVALGASMIEKHFTLDRTLEGPDHAFALEPADLRAMVQGIREAEVSLGSGRKDGPQKGEMTELRGRQLTWMS